MLQIHRCNGLLLFFSSAHRLLYFWAFESAESQVRLYLLSDAGLHFWWFIFILFVLVCFFGFNHFISCSLPFPPHPPPSPPLPLMSGNWSTPGYVLGQAEVYPFSKYRSWLKCHVCCSARTFSITGKREVDYRSLSWFLLSKMGKGFGLGVVGFGCLFVFFFALPSACFL